MDLKKRLINIGLLSCLLIQLPLSARDIDPEDQVPEKMPQRWTGVIIAGSSLYHGLEMYHSGLVSVHVDAMARLSENRGGPVAGRPLPLDSGGIRPGLRISRTWGWVGSAVALAAGAAGYYFKYRADKSYDKYLNTIVPDQMDRHFNDALKFDKISSACYISGEAILVFSLVVFIKTVNTE